MTPLRQQLEALCHPDEVVSGLEPERLGGGAWWARLGRGAWPEPLRAGLIEPRRGYRARPEGLALAALLDPAAPPERLVDLGAGTGPLLLVACHVARPGTAVAVERQEAQADRLRRTLAAHELDARVVCGDLREPAVRDATRRAIGGGADVVVANPPFFPPGWGRPSGEASTRQATHAEHGDVGAFLSAATELLAPDGRVLVVYDASRLAEALVAAGEVGLGPSRVVVVRDQRTGREREPFRVWLELRRGATDVAWLG